MKTFIDAEFADFYSDKHESLAVSESDNNHVLALLMSAFIDIGYSNDLGGATCQ